MHKLLGAAFTGAVLLLTASSIANAEMVYVKYRGPVDTAHFQCESISRSSFINRVCYDGSNQYGYTD